MLLPRVAALDNLITYKTSWSFWSGHVHTLHLSWTGQFGDITGICCWQEMFCKSNIVPCLGGIGRVQVNGWWVVISYLWHEGHFIGDLSFTLLAFCQDKLASPVNNIIGILSGLMQVLSPTFMASCQDWLASDTTNIHGNQSGQFLSPTLLALYHHRFASPVTHSTGIL